jgi:iron only hydrogenase large subunit-like protein
MKRLKAIYSEDESKTLRQSHLNPSITAIYKDYLGKRGGHLSHELLHTHYFDRSKDNE